MPTWEVCELHEWKSQPQQRWGLDGAAGCRLQAVEQGGGPGPGDGWPRGWGIHRIRKLESNPLQGSPSGTLALL